MGVIMFLKRIEMQGFKSFADKAIIHFNDAVTGVVGPNGCGKSNISDAVRWVLGEQSVKSMRGNTMTDIIFNGSESRRKVNLAEVSLVFNNELKVLNSEYEEVEVTRRLYRDTRESEYLINKVPCRLRDIHDLVMDTGLGRDSLSIISQGSISFFAEAKPQERRVIFEEAAGVSKYKKRKIESINKLERTQENIERLQDIAEEIGRQVTPLRRAAKKAELFSEKKDALEAIEVSVLVADIEQYIREMKEKQSEIQNLEIEIANYETRIGVYEHELDEKRQEGFNLDQSISKSQERMMHFVREIGILETRKIEIEEKRKYALEVGNREEKAKETYALLMDAKVEYDERLNRQQQLKAEVEILVAQTLDINRNILEKQQQVDFVQTQKSKSKQRLDLLEHRLERPYEANHGVQTIMDNKTHLFGIHDTVGNLLLPQEGYEIAIATTLAGAAMHIVTEQDAAAVNAIQFLKRNQSGRATFIPLNVVRERTVHRDALTVCEHAEGFKGIANEFIETEATYHVLRDSLLGNVLVVDTIDNANTLAKRLKHMYRIVTLDGDVIHQGGTITGGKSRDIQNSLATLRIEKDQIEKQLQKYDIELDVLKLELDQIRSHLRQDNDELMQKRIALAQIEPLLDVKRAKFERLQSDYDALGVENPEPGVVTDDVVTQLNLALIKRDELTSKLSLDRERRMSISHETQRKEALVKRYRSELNQVTQDINTFKMKHLKLETQRDNALDRLSSEYQMTYEYALSNIYDADKATMREDVLLLRSEIQKLGNINLDAPKEYEEVNQRFEFLETQLKDLIDSREKLLKIIEETDEIMKIQFMEMFERINAELQGVFSKLFKGGRAKLILENPEDILNTGVDIDVQPPGKSVQNIRLFSGGEKSLIAISVLFSIINARHVPLCIFDEVEAALDQMNVERLANYIRELSNETQFILITHRPGTMEKCDTLYGVTMPTQGVSSLLKVRLEEAIELREESANGVS